MAIALYLRRPNASPFRNTRALAAILPLPSRRQNRSPPHLNSIMPETALPVVRGLLDAWYQQHALEELARSSASKQQPDAVPSEAELEELVERALPNVTELKDATVQLLPS